MRITSLRQQKRRGDRVSVFLDEEFWIGITDRLCNEIGLFVGQEIEEAEKEEIEKRALSDGALQYAFDRLGNKLLPEAELRRKLQSREYSPGTIDSVIERCWELQLLDDGLWAQTVAEERKVRGQGRRRVAEILRQGGISTDQAEGVLEEVFPADKEVEEAREALDARFGETLDPAEQRRAWSFLLQRGFSSEAAKGAVSERAMSAEEAEAAYGWEEALRVLQARFRQPVERHRARAYLQRRAFSSSAIEEALRSFDRLIP
jgi:regulatory protein